jgi:hypothetical protein
MEPARQGQESAWWNTALRPGNLPYTLSLISPSEASECKLTLVNILALVNWSEILTTPPTPPNACTSQHLNSLHGNTPGYRPIVAGQPLPSSLLGSWPYKPPADCSNCQPRSPRPLHICIGRHINSITTKPSKNWTHIIMPTPMRGGLINKDDL